MADVRGPFGVEKPITTKNIGAAAPGCTVVEYGDGTKHQTVITVDTVFPVITGASTYGVGTLVYTFPGGALDVKATYISMSITQTDDNITDDTPDIGVGTTIGTSTSGTLNGGTMENLMPGQAADDCDGTAEVKHSVTSLLITTLGNHAVYFNAADTWAGSDAAAIIAGTIIIEWTFVV